MGAPRCGGGRRGSIAAAASVEKALAVSGLFSSATADAAEEEVAACRGEGEKG